MYSRSPSKWAVGNPSVIRTIWRFGVSQADRCCRDSWSPCWMLVKCGWICVSETLGSLMSHHNRTQGSWTVTGLGIISKISPGERILANVYISTNFRKSPGYSLLINPCNASAHAFHIDILTLIPHRAAHIHDDAGRTLGMIASFVNDDIIATQTDRSFIALS